MFHVFFLSLLSGYCISIGVGISSPEGSPGSSACRLCSLCEQVELRWFWYGHSALYLLILEEPQSFIFNLVTSQFWGNSLSWRGGWQPHLEDRPGGCFAHRGCALGTFLLCFGFWKVELPCAGRNPLSRGFAGLPCIDAVQPSTLQAVHLSSAPSESKQCVWEDELSVLCIQPGTKSFIPFYGSIFLLFGASDCH